MQKQIYIDIFDKLYDYYGPQNWWPADTTLEMLLGAILVQRTNWRNAEKALTQLGTNITADDLFYMNEEELGIKIRSSGFYRIKATRIKKFIQWFRTYHYNLDEIRKKSKEQLRSELLSIHGIGEETADVMLLYAFDQYTFVADQYAIRIFERIGIVTSSNYKEVRKDVEAQLPSDLRLYQEYHALIVEHAKKYCRKNPICYACPLLEVCALGKQRKNESEAQLC